MSLTKLIKKSRGKKRNQIIHAESRFNLRLKIPINENQYNQILNIIRKGRATFIEKQSNRVSLYELDFERQRIRVIYDKKNSVVVTAWEAPVNNLDITEERSNKNGKIRQ